MGFHLNIDVTYRVADPQLPTIESEYNRLWQFANVLTRAGLPVDKWYPAADSEKTSRLNAAFDAKGPTSAAITMAKSSALSNGTSVRSLGVWNGLEGDGSAAFSDSQGIDSVCSVTFQMKGIVGFQHATLVTDVVSEAARIWPASSVQVGPFKYFSHQQVFEKRPGAGWMLYLPRVLTAQQVPEARALVPVMDCKQRIGTLIVSVIGEPFSASNPEHVKVANAIEERLVDQDLLPLFTEL
ncbi:immunity 52 family protein [Paraburkholderia fungorum]|uniref:immunity 52 family protein n=1 Tax=Paraburkholderia fungorum TaxID=134537 RepID=UPI00402B86A5